MAWYDILNQSNVRGRDAGSIARQRLNARAAMPPVPAPSASAGGLLGNVTKGLALLNPVTAYSIPGFGEQRQKNRQYVIDLSKGPLNELRYIGGALSRGQLPYSGTQAGAEQRQNPLLGRVPVPGTDSGWWRGSVGSLDNLPAERDYRQQVSNIAQQAAQNPELQRYAKERAAAAASKDQGKMDAARDIGMQIWAQKYGGQGGLASKVKPGQSGYDVIQRTLGAGQMGSPINFGFDPTRAGADNTGLLSPTPSVTAPSYAGATPAGLPGARPLPSNAFSGIVTTPFSGLNSPDKNIGGQTLTSAPLGIPGIPPTGSYEGATGVQPMGSSLDMFNPADEKARALLEAFKNAQFGVQK